ncbi:LysR family transcriptional regulator [Xanthobacter dioxanivorans]|uniref:LysR family transcriptional regulator n=1 Tax=Xanthobacter dioxanivorans TaxID=2528964 RepID=A0A974SJF6_9HYPH|nr:LysR family transcriptional regulator [Xanthobacter dioxanivorans]QRG06353.1 LysR family transcriptional regulator [Xanthobacter dioxanivorans]
MDIRQLKYFVQIAESGNFSRAAEVLRIAQPSLSQQMKNLEEELGVGLLLRHARGVTLTELGQQLYDHARRILQEVDRVKDVVRSSSLNPSGRVSVGLPTSACRGLGLPLIQALAERQPNISLHVVEAMTGYLDDFLQHGRLDVALLYDHKAFEHVAWTEMMVEELMLFVPPGHPLAEQGSVSFREMFDWPIVLPGAPNVMRTVIEQFAARHDVVPAAMACDSLPTIARLVRSGRALGVMPHFAFMDEMERGEMTAVPILDPTPSWRLSVVVSQRSMNPRGSEAVAKVMADVIAAMVDSGTWRARLRTEKARGEARLPAR